MRVSHAFFVDIQMIFATRFFLKRLKMSIYFKTFLMLLCKCSFLWVYHDMRQRTSIFVAKK
jgi:hypothetical protein